MAGQTITKADEGKRVLNADGTEIGRLVRVSNGRSYVDLNPGFVGTVKAKLGWGDGAANAHPLDEGSIARVTDDAVYLRGTL